MSTTDDGTDPLVDALRRKVNYQADRIDDLEEEVSELQATITQLRREIAEVEE